MIGPPLEPLNGPTPHPIEVGVQAASEMRGQGVPVVDVREPAELDQARLPDTLDVPMSVLAARLAVLEPLKDAPFLVLCHGGVRSLQVVQALRSRGWPHAISIAGGIDAWSQVVDPSVPRY